MADRRVKVIVEAEVSKFEAGTKRAARASEDLAKSTDQASKSTEKLGNSGGAMDGLRGKLSQLADESSKVGKAAQDIVPALTGIGVVGAAGFAKAVTTAASFDKAMSGVQAATHATASDMQALSDAAIKAGADTAFSAEEAAGAIEELSKAGVSTTDILNGGLNGALALAAAGELEVADAAEIAASAMTQFGLSGGDIPHIADLLAAGAGKAQGSVQDLGQALNQAGLVANATGLSIEETTGGLAAFASAGLVGSDAGTSFKSMLQRLTPQSDKAAQLMDELGLSAYDAQGNFVGLSEYAGILQDGLSGMTAEQRNATMATLFGSDAVRAANILYEQGADGIQQWEEAVNDAGYAAETAAIMQDNLAGDLEKLGGAFDTVFLQAGTGANEALRGLVQAAEGFVDTIGRLPTPVLQAAAGLSGLVGAAGLAGAGFITVLPKIKETRDALDTLAPAGGRARGALKGLGIATGVAVGIGALVTGLTALYNSTSETTPSVEDVTNALLKLGDTGDMIDIDSMFQFDAVTTHISGLADALDHLDLDNPVKHIQSFGDTVVGLENPMSQAREAIATLDTALAGMDTETASKQMNALRLEMEAAGRTDMSSWSSLKELFPEYTAGIEAAANATGKATTDADLFQAAMGNLPPHMQAVAEGGEAAGAGAEAGAEGMAALGDASEETEESLSDVVERLQTLGVINQSVHEATGAAAQSVRDLAESVKENGKSLDVTTEKGYANVQAMHGVAQSAWDLAEANAGAGESAEVLRGNLQGGYDALVRQITAMTGNEEAARRMAAEIMGIPPEVSVETWMDDTAAEMAQATGQAVGQIPEGVNVIADMTDSARAKAFETAETIKTIPGHKKVDVAVDDNGTPGQVQSRVNAITGKTEYVFVTDDGTVNVTQKAIKGIDGKTEYVYVSDDGTVVATQKSINAMKGKDIGIVVDDKGTSATVQKRINQVTGKTEYLLVTDKGTINATQQKIKGVDGKDVTVYVDDKGTVYTTQGEIYSIKGKTVTIQAVAATAAAEAAINRLARPRTAVINVFKKAMNGFADGGVVGSVPHLATGGRLPYYGLGTDQIVGVGSNGRPTAMVDDGEWVIRESSARKYNRLLSAINADAPTVQHLAGYASGGAVGREWSGSAMAPAAFSMDYARLSRAVNVGGFPDRVTLVDESGGILANARVVAEGVVQSDQRQRAMSARRGVKVRG